MRILSQGRNFDMCRYLFNPRQLREAFLYKYNWFCLAKMHEYSNCMLFNISIFFRYYTNDQHPVDFPTYILVRYASLINKQQFQFDINNQETVMYAPVSAQMDNHPYYQEELGHYKLVVDSVEFSASLLIKNQFFHRILTHEYPRWTDNG